MKKTGHTVMLFLGVFALSTSAVFVKLAGAPASITAFYRLFFALLVLIPLMLSRKERRKEIRLLSKKQLALAGLSGLSLAVHYILWFESLNHTSVASSTVIVTLQPLFSLLLGFFFLRERHSRFALSGSLVAISGSLIIGYGDFQTGWEALLGDLMALSAAAFISLYFFIGQLSRRRMSATVYSAAGYAASVVFLALYALVKGEAFFAYPLSTWQSFLGLALVSTILGQFIFNLLLKNLSATAVSMSILGEPAGTCILAYFILDEVISYGQGLGMILILGGLALFFLFRSPLEKSSL